MKGWAFACLLGAAASSPAPRPAPPEPTPVVVVIPGGSQLREDPDRNSPPLTLIDEEVQLVPLERRGDWVMVRWQSWRGWVWLREEEEEPRLQTKEQKPNEKTPKDRTRNVYSSPERIQKAIKRGRFVTRFRQILRHPSKPRRFGSLSGRQDVPIPFEPFSLTTDVQDVRLLQRLEATATSMGHLYNDRLVLDDSDPQEIWIFSRPGADAEFFKENLRPIGIVALSVVERDLLQARLVHELAHVLNHPGGIEIPWWLDEGLAESLSASTFAPDGALRPQTLTPKAQQSVARLLAAVSAGASLSLSAVRREASGCVAGAEPAMAHPKAAMLARYLLVGPRGDTLKRLFSDAFSREGPVTNRALLSALGTDEATLERELREWLTRQ